jgi:hypothetical protein
MPGRARPWHRGRMRKEQAVAQGQAGAPLVAGVLGGGLVALYGGITTLGYVVASYATIDHDVALPGALRILGFAGVPAGITAMAVGVNAARRIRARRRPGYAEVTAGWLSGAVGLVLYVAAAGYGVLGSLYYYG